MKIAKFNIRNKDKSNAIGVVRLSTEQFEAIRAFMHHREGTQILRFHFGVRLVPQGSGWYYFWPADSDENPTPALVRAIRLASKALFIAQAEQRAHARQLKARNVRPVAYVGGQYVNVKEDPVTAEIRQLLQANATKIALSTPKSGNIEDRAEVTIELARQRPGAERQVVTVEASKRRPVHAGALDLGRLGDKFRIKGAA